MRPFKSQLTQELLPADKPKRLQFCDKLLIMMKEGDIDLDNVFSAMKLTST